VFSPWMNVAGSVLANYWRKHPVKEAFVVASEEREVKKEVDS
jgi:BASS family bile acid:Na+ symporter